jgi:hypothetical protein
VPVVSHGKDWVFGQMLKDLAAFLGVAYNMKPTLSPQELIDKLDMVMSAAQRYVAQIPAAKLDDDLRNRKRPIRTLCYHIFRLEEGFMEVVEDGIYLTHDVLSPPIPPHLRTNADLVAYGRQVQQRQLMLLLRENGIEPDGPLSEADFAGLPLPKKAWDDEVA